MRTYISSDVIAPPLPPAPPPSCTHVVCTCEHTCSRYSAHRLGRMYVRRQQRGVRVGAARCVAGGGGGGGAIRVRTGGQAGRRAGALGLRRLLISGFSGMGGCRTDVTGRHSRIDVETPRRGGNAIVASRGDPMDQTAHFPPPSSSIRTEAAQPPSLDGIEICNSDSSVVGRSGFRHPERPSVRPSGRPASQPASQPCGSRGSMGGGA